MLFITSVVLNCFFVLTSVLTNLNKITNRPCTPYHSFPRLRPQIACKTGTSVLTNLNKITNHPCNPYHSFPRSRSANCTLFQTVAYPILLRTVSTLDIKFLFKTCRTHLRFAQPECTHCVAMLAKTILRPKLRKTMHPTNKCTVRHSSSLCSAT